MSKETPDFHDAELAMRVYELRRETVMRASRDAITFLFWPKSYEDIQAISSRPDHSLNPPLRQISSYWEMVYGMVRHGIVNADFFLESNGEGLFLFAKIQPFLEQIRGVNGPNAYKNAEWVATQCEPGIKRFAIIKARVAKMAETQK
jgi:hypothetical protein